MRFVSRNKDHNRFISFSLLRKENDVKEPKKFVPSWLTSKPIPPGPDLSKW